MKALYGGVLLLCCLFVEQVQGQHWTLRHEPPAGHSIEDAVCFGENGVIAVGHEGVILRTDDLFKRWKNTPTGVKSMLLGVAQSSKGTFIAVGRGGTILRSPDMGHTWSSVSFASKSNLNDVVSSENRLIAVGSGGVVGISDDDGVSWRIQTLGEMPEMYGLAFRKGRGVIVGSAGKALTSQDNGATWSLALHDVPIRLTAVEWRTDNEIIAGGDTTYLARSKDGGLTWENRGKLVTVDPLFPDQASVRDVYFENEREGYAAGRFFRVLGYGHFALFHTSDGGETWTRLSLDQIVALGNPPILNMALEPAVVVKTGSGIMLAAGHGMNSKPTPFVARFTTNDNDRQGVFYEEGAATILRYPDDTLVSSSGIGFSPVKFFDRDHGFSLQRGPLKSRQDSQYGLTSRGGSRSLITENGGISWTETLPMCRECGFRAFYPTHNAIDLSVERDTLLGRSPSREWLRSTDMGKTWIIHPEMTSFFRDSISSIISYAAVGNGSILVTATPVQQSVWGRRLFMRSDDDGKTWRNIEPPPHQVFLYGELTFADNMVGGLNDASYYDTTTYDYIRGSWTTVDGGETWSQLFPPNNSKPFLSARKVGNEHWLFTYPDSIGGEKNHWTWVYRSSDGGKTWKSESFADHPTLRELTKDRKVITAKLFNSNVGFMVAEKLQLTQYDNHRILFTTDGGNVWRDANILSTGYVMSSIDIFDDRNVFVGSGNNMMLHFDPLATPTSVAEEDSEHGGKLNNVGLAVKIWNLYPNPMHGGKATVAMTFVPNIAFEDIRFRLYTINGIESAELSSELKIEQTSPGYVKMTIDLQNKPSGVYFFSAEAAGSRSATLIVNQP